MSETVLIELDGSSWKTKQDVYKALLAALQAPDWHGHNLDALSDSLRGGDINGVNPPLMITLFGSQTMAPEALDAARQIERLCAELAETGVPVDVALAIGDI